MQGEGTLALRLLGTFRLDAPDGERIDIRSKRSQALLALLASSPGGERSRGWLQSMLWSERAPQQGRASLRRELSNLRPLLNAQGDILLVDHQNVALDLTRLSVDLLRDPLPAGGDLLEGLDIPGEDNLEEWLRTERRALDTRRSDPAAAVQQDEEPVPLPPVLDGTPPGSDSGAVAVMPFVAHLRDQAQVDHALDVAEDLIERLARMRWLPVVARSTSFKAAERASGDPRQVGRMVGARYLVEGRVSGDAEVGWMVRVELSDSQTGKALLADRFEWGDAAAAGPKAAVMAEIAAAIGMRIEQEEQQRSLRVPDGTLDLGDMVWRARYHLGRLTDGDSRRARDYLQRVLEVEPGQREARIQLLWLNIRDLWLTRAAPDDIRAARRNAQKLMQLDTDDARPYTLAGIAELWLREVARAENLLHHAIERNPSLAMSYSQLGGVQYFRGQFDAAIASLERAQKLGPTDHDLFFVHGQFALTHLLAGRSEEAIDHAEQALGLRAGYWFGHMAKTVALVECGRDEDARRALADLLHAKPDFSLRYVKWLPFDDARHREFLCRGLNRAGYSGD